MGHGGPVELQELGGVGIMFITFLGMSRGSSSFAAAGLRPLWLTDRHHTMGGSGIDALLILVSEDKHKETADKIETRPGQGGHLSQHEPSDMDCSSVCDIVSKTDSRTLKACRGQ
jgi:hypothetical protein